MCEKNGVETIWWRAETEVEGVSLFIHSLNFGLFIPQLDFEHQYRSRML